MLNSENIADIDSELKQFDINDEKVKIGNRDKERYVNIDLIRDIALFFLISVHFIMYSEFYDGIMNTPMMYFMSGVRAVSMLCIPLFILITGYLMSGKKFGAGYFKGLARILIIFFIYKIFVLLYMRFYQHNTITPAEFIAGLSNNTEYTWYIGLYIWLYMLIPFLNVIYKSMNEKWKKQALVLASFGLIILPTFCNYYQQSVPDPLYHMYPIAYYLTGAYIKEYNNKDKKWMYFILFLLSLAASIVINILISYNKKFVSSPINDWRGFENFAMGTFLFVFLSKLDLSRIPNVFKKILKVIAELSLGAYLCSWIADSTFYPKFKVLIPNIPDRMKYYVIMVPIIIVSSLILSAAANLIYALFNKGCSAAYSGIKTAFCKTRRNQLDRSNEMLDISAQIETPNMSESEQDSDTDIISKDSETNETSD